MQTDVRQYDVVVIGAGPPGENVAERVVRGGLSCAVVEAELVGGECSYWACMPSKALLRPMELRAAVRRVPGLPALAGDGRLDVTAVLARRDEFTHHHHDAAQVSWLAGVPADLIRGHGRLLGPRRVGVDLSEGGTLELTARRAVVLATGSSAAIPDIPGLAEAEPWTSRELTAVRRIPQRLLLIGGGVVSVEMAQAYAALGSAVTLVVRGPGLLAGFEPFAGQFVADALRADGVDVRLGRQVNRVDTTGEQVRAVLDDGSELTTDQMAVATGRRPRTDDLGLDTIGLPAGRYVQVDDALTVPVPGAGTGDPSGSGGTAGSSGSSGSPGPTGSTGSGGSPGSGGAWLYAVGDVNGRNLLTHMGKYQARICGDVIVARAGGTDDGSVRAYADRLGAPQVVFTDPQVAMAGLTERAAIARGRRVTAVEYEIGEVAGAALLADGYRGRAKLVVDAGSQAVLGATFVGQEVAEIVQAATVAVAGGLTVDQLWHAVPAYPTVSEVWLRLLEAFGR